MQDKILKLALWQQSRNCSTVAFGSHRGGLGRVHENAPVEKDLLLASVLLCHLLWGLMELYFINMVRENSISNGVKTVENTFVLSDIILTTTFA